MFITVQFCSQNPEVRLTGLKIKVPVGLQSFLEAPGKYPFASLFQLVEATHQGSPSPSIFKAARGRPVLPWKPFHTDFSPASPPSSFKDSKEFMGPTQVIQDEFPILRSPDWQL